MTAKVTIEIDGVILTGVLRPTDSTKKAKGGAIKKLPLSKKDVIAMRMRSLSVRKR